MGTHPLGGKVWLKTGGGATGGATCAGGAWKNGAGGVTCVIGIGRGARGSGWAGGHGGM